MVIADRHKKREKARSHWDSASIVTAVGDEVDIEVRRPLSAMLSLRLDKDQVARLKQVASARHVGVTTAARLLLIEALDAAGAQPLGSSTARARKRSQVTADMQLVFSEDELERLSKDLSESARKVWVMELKSRSTVSRTKTSDRENEPGA